MDCNNNKLKGNNDGRQEFLHNLRSNTKILFRIACNATGVLKTQIVLYFSGCEVISLIKMFDTHICQLHNVR